MAICEICKKTFKCITVQHLKQHSIYSMKEYIKMFPNAKLKDKSCIVSVNTEDFWVKKYGYEEGIKKYKEYKEKMAYSNTYQYKKEKYGWSREEFDAYNKSRAITLDNMIKKHGIVKGKEVYYEYVKKQKHAGTSEEYFIKKYGFDDGKRIYREVCDKKAHTIENYKRLYGPEFAHAKLKEFQEKNNTMFVSDLEKEFIDSIISCLPTELQNNKVYNYSTKQFGQWCHSIDNYVFYDLIMYEYRLCIEFNGDYWHCNPKKYNENFFHPHIKKSARDIWYKDEQKIETIKNQGFKVLVVWENEYVNDKEKTIEETKLWIYQNMN